MKKILFKVLPIAAAIVLATSCSKDNEDSNNVINPENNTPTPEVVTPKTSSVTMSFKVNTSAGLSKIGIAEDNGNLGVSPKFDGDEVINFADADNLVTGSVTLTAANLTNDGKTAEFEVTFDGEDENIEKFKNGEITLTATIGNKLTAISPTSYPTLEYAMRANSYQVSKDAITFSDAKTDITFVEHTAYLEIGLPVTNTTVKINDIDYKLTYGRGWIALPVGTKVTSEALSLTDKEVAAAKIYTIHRQVFSVSPTKKVHFSAGNLQYNVRTSEWRFAPNQYDKCYTVNTDVGDDYANIISGSTGSGLSAEGWTDLFGWGMWLEGQIPNNTFPYDDSEYLKEIDQDGVDFPYASAIGYEWNTLSISEWDYLFNTREDADQKYGIATVNEINGIVLLPDTWTCPEGLTFTPGMASVQGKTHYVDKGNIYSDADWIILESSGAVFLPVTGNLSVKNSGSWNNPGIIEYNYVVYQQSTAYYWSSTSYRHVYNDDPDYIIDDYPDWYESYYMQFTSNNVYTNSVSRRHYGSAVRLVQGFTGTAITDTDYKLNFGLSNDIEAEW